MDGKYQILRVKQEALSILKEFLNDYDAIDGDDEPDGAGYDDQQKKMYKKVANTMEQIADKGACSKIDRNIWLGLTDLERELAEYIVSEKVTSPAKAVVKDQFKHLTYSRFTHIIEAYIKNKNKVPELVAFYALSRSAIRVVGAGCDEANEIKDHFLCYFEDTFASSIVEQGGWDSALETLEIN